MTLTIDDEVAMRLRTAAANRGEDVNRYASSLIAAALPQEHSEAEQNSAAIRFVRPAGPPDWVVALQPENPPTDGTNGFHRLVGTWPGDETDEEIDAALQHLEDSDVA